MKRYTFLIYMLTILLFLGCSSTKNSGDPTLSDTKIINEQLEKEMLEAGFSKGVVVFSEIEGDCPYTIKVIDSDLYFDPINLEENFQKDGLKIWFTYGGLRRANRCIKANPIGIIAIQERVE